VRVVAAIGVLAALGCGHYGPPRRPEAPRAAAIPVVMPAPAPAAGEPAAPDPEPSGEQCEAPAP
jgi:hypothetical protein